MMDFSECEIIDGCIMNDRKCQELLYRRYFQSMMSFISRYTNDKDESIEILNNGFLRVFKKINLFRAEGSLEGWIRRIIFHAIADYFKNQSKSIHFLVLEEHEKAHQSDTIEKFYAEDLIKLVEKLPDRTQEVFRLFALEGFSHLEIASELSISEGTSKWHLSEARKKLKNMLSNHSEFKHYVR